MQISKLPVSYAAGGVAALALLIVSFMSLTAAGSLNEAADAQQVTSALNTAAGGVRKAWADAMYADSLAAAGGNQSEARSTFDTAEAAFNGSLAVFAAGGFEQVAPAVAGLEQAWAGLSASFETTATLASTDPAAAAANHAGQTAAVYAAAGPAIDGLGLFAAGASASLQSSLEDGASTLRLASYAGVGVGVIAAAALAAVVALGMWKQPVQPIPEAAEGSDDHQASQAA